MRWTPGHQSPDLIDRRGARAPMSGAGGLLSFLPLLLGRKHGWLILLAIGAIWLLGGGWRSIFGGGEAEQAAAPPPGAEAASPMVQFSGFVLDDAQATWQREFEKRGMQYQNAKMVVFSDATQSACGVGDAATGPFYCPRDSRVYVDLSFFDELDRKFGAPGDFAQAYVIAHEIGHHVQNQLGTSDKVHAAPRSRQAGAEGMAVRLELQADCYAGVWAHWTGRRDLLEQGDVEEGLRAASAIGDDRLQKSAGRRVQPESWTHGSSAQRSAWFRKGFETGAMETCDTFNGSI
jgi:predicted metalloprotease